MSPERFTSMCRRWPTNWNNYAIDRVWSVLTKTLRIEIWEVYERFYSISFRRYLIYDWFFIIKYKVWWKHLGWLSISGVLGFFYMQCFATYQSQIGLLDDSDLKDITLREVKGSPGCNPMIFLIWKLQVWVSIFLRIVFVQQTESWYYCPE